MLGALLFWSILINSFVFSIFSLFAKQSDVESETANVCVKSSDISEIIDTIKTPIDLTLTDLQNILTNFFGENYANEKIEEFLKSIKKDRAMLTTSDIDNLKNIVERPLLKL